jgi:thioredoxin-related protein
MNRFASSLLWIICFSIISACSGKDQAQRKQSTGDLNENVVNWMTIEQAEAASLEEPKPMFVMVYANWCPHCKNFDKTTYQDPKVIKDLNTRFYPVKLNAHSNETISYRATEYTNPNFDPQIPADKANSYHELLYAIEAKSIPSIVFIDKDFNVRGTELGYKPADELRSLMSMYNN